MSQQQQYPQGQTQYQPLYGPQAQAPGRIGAQAQGQFGQATSQRFKDSVPTEVVSLVKDLDRLVTTCEWAEMRALERGLDRVARTCEDIAEIAHLEKKMIVRQSPVVESVSSATQDVIQNSIPVLQQHSDQPDIQDVLTEAQRCLDAIGKAIPKLGAVGAGGVATQQFGSRQLGTEQFGQGRQQAGTY